MVKIDTIVFEFLKPPPRPPRIVSCLKHSGSDRVKKCIFPYTITTVLHWVFMMINAPLLDIFRKFDHGSLKSFKFFKNIKSMKGL